jgi:hypothetical protein
MKTHENMRAINAWMCPWLIAAFGKNYADWDNVDAAMLMLSHVIVTHEIGGYTASSYQAAVRGYKMELLAFTKFVLRNVGSLHSFVRLALCGARVLTNIEAGKASIVHRKDMRAAMKLLCTQTREVENRAQIVALRGVGIKTLDAIMLSRQSIPFLDELCIEKGIVGEPVIFQTDVDKKAKKTSIVGAGATPGEQHLRWIIGELCWTSVSNTCLSC